MGRKNRRMKIHAKRLPTVREIQRDAVRTDIHPKRLEIWYAHLPMRYDSRVQGGGRPVLIISNDIVNEHSGVITVLPLTSQLKRLFMPTHVFLAEGTHEMEKSSVILAEQIMAIDKKILAKRIGKLTDPAVVREVEDAVREQLSIKNQEKENTENENHHL